MSEYFFHKLNCRPPCPQFPSWTTGTEVLACFTKRSADTDTLSIPQTLCTYAEVGSATTRGGRTVVSNLSSRIASMKRDSVH